MVQLLVALLTLDKAIQKIQGLIDAVQRYINKLNEIPIIGNLIPDSITGTNRASQVTNNINVRGAVDPQGTARTITRVLNTANRTSGLRAFA